MSDLNRGQLDVLLATLYEHMRVYEDLVRMTTRIENQCQAIERRLGLRKPMRRTIAGVELDGDLAEAVARQGAKSRKLDTPSALALEEGQKEITLLRELAAPIMATRNAKQKQIEQIAARLPLMAWVRSVRGLGAFSFAQIIAATTRLDGDTTPATVHDLCDYDNPAKVWKRMGLAVLNGQRQRKVTNRDEAIAQGYSPRKRAIMFVIGENLVKLNTDGMYRDIYANRKAIEHERHAELTPIACHLRAMRYMTKILLKHIWQQWRYACAEITDEGTGQI